MIIALSGKKVSATNSWGQASSLPGFATDLAPLYKIETEIDNIDAGTSVLISSPFNLSHNIVQISIPLPKTIYGSLGDSSFSNLSTPHSFDLSIKNKMKPFSVFPLSHWSYQLNVKLAISDQLERSVWDPDIKRMAPILWTTRFKFPLSFPASAK